MTVERNSVGAANSRVSHPSPGPWTTEQDGSLVINREVLISPAMAGPEGSSHEERLANLRLWAASKALLEAAEMAAAILSRLPVGSDPEISLARVAKAEGVLQAAIAKAVGGDL